jgi:hypothetical protein
MRSSAAPQALNQDGRFSAPIGSACRHSCAVKVIIQNISESGGVRARPYITARRRPAFRKVLKRIQPTTLPSYESPTRT